MTASKDFYIDEDTGLLVFTVHYHLKRGYCCGKQCRHCPYHPKYNGGTTTVAEKYLDQAQQLQQ